ncbi:hypothetical protein AB4144_55920 [Rhizobiaceae sp. 2RAB30]
MSDKKTGAPRPPVPYLRLVHSGPGLPPPPKPTPTPPERFRFDLYPK